MSSRRVYREKEAPRAVPDTSSALPVERPIAVYYRQSTDAQIGNVSTTIQTVDMVEYLKGRGWAEHNIAMIDMDAGVSGTKKIDQRPGMRLLFDMITAGELGAVACQDEDRLFRDVTQIQVNIFIEACRQAGVLVLTPTMVYDFAHPGLGSFHSRQFRFKSEMAAEYISSYIRGKLHPAKKRRMMEGRWAGGTAPMGYMIDERKVLADGTKNENWRRYVPFEPHAEIVHEYFRLFVEFAGNLNATAHHVARQGPFVPDPRTWTAPEGFRFSPPRILRSYGPGYCPGKTGLLTLLTNAAYIGHWAVNDEIVRWNNHPAIIPVEVFMTAFNYLSEVTLDGKPNVHYMPFAPSVRPTKDEARPVERPLCAGMIFTHLNGRWKKAGSHYLKRKQTYGYCVMHDFPNGSMHWFKKAEYVDEEVERLVKAKLEATFSPVVWEQTLAEVAREHGREGQFKQKQLVALENAMANLLASLESISHPDMIQRIEARYAEAQAEHERLQQDIALVDEEVTRLEAVKALREICGSRIEHWSGLSIQQKRTVLHAFIARIEAEVLGSHVLQFTICWRDGSRDPFMTGRRGVSYLGWLPDEETELRKVLESCTSQSEICARFPTRTWASIRNKAYGLDGLSLQLSGEHPIRDKETYQLYLRRISHPNSPYLARDAEHWQPQDVTRLLALLEDGASQIEIAAAFPFRRWARIRAKITELRGPIVIPGTGQNGRASPVRKEETYAMYLQRTDPKGQPDEVTLSDTSSEGACWMKQSSCRSRCWK